MAESGQISFTPIIEDSGFLTIEQLIGVGINPPLSTAPILMPPLRQSMFDPRGARNKDKLIDWIEAGGPVPQKSWADWFQSITRAVSNGWYWNRVGLGLVGFLTPSIDDTDTAWYATTGAVNSTDDPLTFTAAITGSSAYGRDFAVGDYIIWNDPTSSGGTYSYEIAKITVISGANWTVQRHARGADAGIAMYGSPLRAHGAGVHIFRLVNKYWGMPIRADVGPQVLKFPWPNMIVVAVEGQAGIGPLNLVNLATTPPSPAAAGLDTGPI